MLTLQIGTTLWIFFSLYKSVGSVSNILSVLVSKGKLNDPRNSY